MNSDMTFRISLAGLMIGLAGVRFYYTKWATVGFPKSDGKVSVAEISEIWQILVLSLGWLWVIAPWVYVFVPRWLEWATFPMSVLVRWIGIGLGIIGIAFALFLASANWFIAVIGIGYWLLVATMVGVEEAALIEAFGEAYRAYMRRTGRFVPRF